MGKIVVIVGMSGVGKTTLINNALDQLEGYTVVNYGTVMLSTAKKTGLVETRDQLRLLSIQQTEQLQKDAAETIKNMGEKIILDTHLTIETDQGYYPGLPFSVLENLPVSQLIVVEAEPESVAKRRNKDATRERVEEAEEEIQQHFDVDRAAAMAIAMHAKCPVKIIINEDLEKATQELIQALQ